MGLSSSKMPLIIWIAFVFNAYAGDRHDERFLTYKIDTLLTIQGNDYFKEKMPEDEDIEARIDFVSDGGKGLGIYNEAKNRAVFFKRDSIVGEIDFLNEMPVAMHFYDSCYYFFLGNSIKRILVKNLSLAETIKLPLRKNEVFNNIGGSRFVGRYLCIKNTSVTQNGSTIKIRPYNYFDYKFDIVERKMSQITDSDKNKLPFVNSDLCDSALLYNLFFKTDSIYQKGRLVADVLSESERYILFVVQTNLVDLFLNNIPMIQRYYVYDKISNKHLFIKNLSQYDLVGRTPTSLAKFTSDSSFVFLHKCKLKDKYMVCRIILLNSINQKPI